MSNNNQPSKKPSRSEGSKLLLRPTLSSASRIRDNVTEPTWRSVAIHSSHQATLIQPTTVSFNKRTKLSGNFDISFHKSSQDAETRPSRWNVPYDRLKSPNWFLLEQTFKVVENTDLDVVTRRIEEVNKELGVSAQYDNNRAQATLQTSDEVEIVINLYKVGKPSVYSKGAGVEVRRNAGCSVLFHRYSHVILAAAIQELDTNDIPRILHPESMLPLPPHPFGIRKQKENAIEGLQMISDLIHKSGFDAQQMGYRSLSLLTDVSKTELPTALMSSRTVLCGGSEDYMEGVREKVFDTLSNWELEENEEKCLSLGIRRQQGSILFNQALTIFTNSLNVLSSHGTQDDIQALYNNFTTQNIVIRLFEVLKHSHVRPHDALLSVKSLNILMKACPDALNDVSNMNMKTVVDHANSFGASSHAALAKECEGILAIL